MMKSMLNQLERLVSKLNPAPHLGNLNFKERFLDLIANDLKRLSLNDPTFLDGDAGYVDFYSPYAEAQIKSKSELLLKYTDNLIVLQAFYMCLQQKKIQIRKLSDKGMPLAALKSDIRALMKLNYSELSERKDIQQNIERIRKVSNCYRQIKKVNFDNVNSRKRIKFQKVINNFEEQKRHLFCFNKVIKKQFSDLEEQTYQLQRELEKHTRLKNKIPKGMFDVKRALNFISFDKNKYESTNQELTSLIIKDNIKFSNVSSEVDNNIKDILKDLQSIMSKSISDYAALAVSGGDMNAFLHKTTGFYWENMYLYRKVLLAANDYIGNQINLTYEGNIVAECLERASEKITDEHTIKAALKAVKKVDLNLNIRQECYSGQAGQSVSDIKFYKKEAHILVSKLLNNSESPFFFVPYNASNYVLDHPPNTDLAGALGNCFGETQMFLQRINQKDPSFYNICPQPDLINYQLDQSRKAGKLDLTIGAFNAQTYGLIRLLDDPNLIDKNHLSHLLNKHSSYALCNAHLYFIDCKKNVISEIKILGKQQYTELNQIFPQEIDQISIAELNELVKIEKITNHVLEKIKVRWDSIKYMLTKKADSKKNGDICWIKLSGARSNEGINFAHVLGFIKMKNATPYKYIVFDYGLGPMGFSDDEQLQLYFQTIIDNYYSFSSFSLKKIAEVSDSCRDFINGPSGISPLKKSEKNTVCVRKYWTKQRLLYLIKYHDDLKQDITLILEHVSLLVSVEAKEEVYKALLNNESIDFNDLLSSAVALAKNANSAPIARILQLDHMPLNLKGVRPNLPKTVSELIVSMIKNGKISAVTACRVFSANENIVFAAFEHTASSLEFAQIQTVLTLMSKYRDIIPAAIAAFPQNESIVLSAYQTYQKDIQILLKADRALIKKFIQDKKIDPLIAVNYFNTDAEIVNAAFATFKNNKGLTKQNILEFIGTYQLSSKHLNQCCKKFSTDQDIIVAAYKIQPESLRYADINLVNMLVKNNLVSHQMGVSEDHALAVRPSEAALEPMVPVFNETLDDEPHEVVNVSLQEDGESSITRTLDAPAVVNQVLSEHEKIELLAKFNILLDKFKDKIIQLEQKPKCIQRGFFTNKHLQNAIIAGKKRSYNLTKARDDFNNHGRLDDFINACEAEFNNEETNNIFAINRSALWFRSLSYSYEQLKKAVYYLSKLVQLPVAANLEKSTTSTAKVSQEFKDGWDNIKPILGKTMSDPTK